MCFIQPEKLKAAKTQGKSSISSILYTVQSLCNESPGKWLLLNWKLRHSLTADYAKLYQETVHLLIKLPLYIYNKIIYSHK